MIATHGRAPERLLVGVAMVLSLLGSIDAFDRDVAHAVQASRMPAAEGWMRGASGLGTPALVLGGVLAIAIFAGPAGVPTARAMIAVLAPVNAVVELTKFACGRVRPDGTRDRANSSFPSSHAANAAAIALLLARRWPRGIPVYVALASAVAYSRMYLNRHFLSDVVCGVAIGLVMAVLVLNRIRGTAWSWERSLGVGGSGTLC